MILSSIALNFMALSVLSSAVTAKEQHEIDYMSKMDEKLRRILEDHADKPIQAVFDKVNDMVEASGNKMVECTKFKEPISIQISNIPGTFSTEELQWFEDTFEDFINGHIDELSELDVHIIRQMEEKKRSTDDGSGDDLLVLIDLYGCYDNLLNRVQIFKEVEEKIQEALEETEQLEMETEELQKKKDAAMSMVEEAKKMKQEEEEKRLQEEKDLEEKQLAEQKALEEQLLEEQKKLEEQQMQEQKMLEEEQKKIEEQQKKAAEEKITEVVTQVVDEVKLDIEKKTEEISAESEPS